MHSLHPWLVATALPSAGPAAGPESQRMTRMERHTAPARQRTFPIPARNACPCPAGGPISQNSLWSTAELKGEAIVCFASCAPCSTAPPWKLYCQGCETSTGLVCFLNSLGRRGLLLPLTRIKASCLFTQELLLEFRGWSPLPGTERKGLCTSVFRFTVVSSGRWSTKEKEVESEGGLCKCHPFFPISIGGKPADGSLVPYTVSFCPGKRCRKHQSPVSAETGSGRCLVFAWSSWDTYRIATLQLRQRWTFQHNSLFSVFT